MPVSKKQQACVHRYIKNHYDRVELTLPKGKKDEIKPVAESLGESVNEFIRNSIDERMERISERRTNNQT